MAVIGSTLYFEDYSPLSVASSIAGQFIDHSGWYLWAYVPGALTPNMPSAISTLSSDWQALGFDSNQAGELSNLVVVGNEADALNALVEAAIAENVVDTKTVKKTIARAKPKPVETATATPTPAPVVSVPVPVETKTAAAVPEAKSGFNSKLIILIVVVGLALGLGITFVGRREPKRKLYR
jgi:hypothetical protein